MPLDEGINTDLCFLLLEVQRQAKATLGVLQNPETPKRGTISHRDDYVDRLRDTIANKGYFNIFTIHASDSREASYTRALLSIANQLELMGGHFVELAEQTTYLKDTTSLERVDFQPYFDQFHQGLSNIYEAYLDTNAKLARQIYKAEQEVDRIYLNDFHALMERVRGGDEPDDQITLIFIIRYLERVGDCFMKKEKPSSTFPSEGTSASALTSPFEKG